MRYKVKVQIGDDLVLILATTDSRIKAENVIKREKQKLTLYKGQKLAERKYEIIKEESDD